MKKLISIQDNFEDTGFAKRPLLSVVRDPEKMPAIVIKDDPTQKVEGKQTQYLMPEVPAGYIKCKKHDCL